MTMAWPHHDVADLDLYAEQWLKATKDGNSLVSSQKVMPPERVWMFFQHAACMLPRLSHRPRLVWSRHDGESERTTYFVQYRSSWLLLWLQCALK